MVRRPPRSPLFPSTTLFRSSVTAPRRRPPPFTPTAQGVRLAPPCPRRRRSSLRAKIGRATSELQSRQYLVCRLLLEKKNRSTSFSRILRDACALFSYLPTLA